MADNQRELLLKFRGDLTTLKKNATEIYRMIQGLGDQVKSLRDKSTSEAKSAHNTVISQIKQQADAQIQQHRQTQAQIAATAAATKAETAAKLQQIQIQQNQIKLEQQKIALKQKELLLEKQINHEGTAKVGHEGGEGHDVSMHLRGLVGNISRDLLGGGSIVSAMIGGAVGGGIFMVLDKLAEKLGELKEFVLESGPLQQLSEQFEKLTKRVGIDGPEMMEKMHEATRNLVGDLTLFRISNNFLQKDLGITEDQIVRLTQVTTGLARAQGKDATQAMQALQRASLTGRTMILSMVTGVDRMALRLRNIPPGVSSATRSIMEFNHTLEVLEARYKAIGEPSLTFAERMKQIQVISERFFEDIAQTTVRSEGFQRLLETFGNVIDRMGGLERAARAIGDTIGGLIGLWAEEINAVGSSIGAITDIVKDAIAPMTDLFGTLKGKDEDKSTWNETIERLSSIRNIFATLAEAIVVANEKMLNFFSIIRIGLRTARESMVNPLNPDTSKMKADLDASFEANRRAANERLFKIEEGRTGKRGAEAALPEQGPDDSQIGLKIAKLQSQIDKEKAKAALESRKAELDEEQRMLNDTLKEGEVSLTDYVDATKEILKEQLKAKQDELDAETKAQKKVFDSELQYGKMTKEEYNKHIELLRLQDADKRKKMDDDYQKQVDNTNEKLIADEIGGRKKKIEDDRKLQQEIISNRRDENEKDFKDNLINAESYLDKKRELASQELKVAQQNAKDKFDASNKGLIAEQDRAFAVAQAKMKYEKEITDITRSEVETRLSYQTRQYQSRVGLAQGRLSIAQLAPAGLGGAEQRAAMQEIINLTQTHMQELYNTEALLLATNKEGTEEWFKTLDAIQKARIEITKMKEELLKAQSNMLGMGGLASQLGTTLAGTRGNFGTLGQVGNFLNILGEAATKRKAIFESDTTGASGISSAGGGIFGNLKDAIANLVHGDGSFADLSKALTGAIGAVGGFIQMLGHSQGKAGDIISGALGGAGMGSQVASTLSSMGGPIGQMMSALGPMAGPIGMAAGAAFGGILSGIIGQKNNQTEKFIVDIKKQISELQTAMQDGSVGIQQGIQSLESMRQTVLAQAGHSKKKQKQSLNQEAQAIQDQIFQLQQQQEAMFYELEQNLKVLNAPNQFQSLLGQLKDIFLQYKKFAGAARDAKDLAMANQFLADSLRNFADTEMTSLNQAEESAIQDALKLNDLLVQRQELITSEAQQEYDIMTQGVLVNQRTQAMTKMNQIQLARNQTNLELEKLNQEIDVTNYKVNAERQIFNLATTRIGLELELTAIQNRLTDKDILRIQALQQVVSVLQSGGQFDSFDSLLSALGLASSVSPTKNTMIGGNQDLQDILNEMRANRARSGFGGQVGYLHS